MATFPQNPMTGSPLIGSPITVTIIPDDDGHSDQWTFHRVILCVYAGLYVPDSSDPNYPSDADFTKLEFAQPVASSNLVQINIESALQAVYDRYQPAAVPPSQNAYVKFRIEAWDEYMIDGNTYTSDDIAVLPGMLGDVPLYYYAFQGAFSDFERLLAGSDLRNSINRWTRKPLSVPEVVFIGEEYVCPIGFHGELKSDVVSDTVPQSIISGAPEGGPKSQEYDVTNDGLKPVDSSTIIPFGDMNVYAIEKPDDGYVLRFVNGLNCMESLHLRCLPKKQVPISTEKYVISRQETFGKFSRGLVVKSGDREEWQMTSGPLDEAWASWYAHEFLKAESAWIKVAAPNNAVVWLPVHVIPEETVTLVDRTKTEPYEVQFTLQMDIEGSPMSALAI